MGIERYRLDFPVTESAIFLNHAAVSPLPRPVKEALDAYNRDRWLYASRSYPEWMVRLDQARSLAARLLGAGPEEIAFTGNTSQGLGIVASGLQWTPGDRILVSSPDFPSNIYPWMHLETKGVVVDDLKRRNGAFSVEDAAAALTPQTKLLAVSSVDYATGFRADLKALGALCRERGVLFCVDAIQSLGVVPLDVDECKIDFLAAGGHKWLMAPMGIGLFYVSKRASDRITPAMVGWRSVVNEEDFRIHFTLKPDAGRFETGTLNLSGIFGLAASLELLLEVGVETICGHVLTLNDRFVAGLEKRALTITSPLEANCRSGILTFRPRGDPALCFRRLMEKNVVCSLRQGCIRLAPHFYNNAADVAEFFHILDGVMSRGAS